MRVTLLLAWASLVAQLAKNLPIMWETWVWSLVSRSPGEGKSYQLQYSGLENSMNHTVHGIKNNQTLPSDFDFWLQSESQMFYSVQFSSVAQSCPTLCDPMECSTPGLSIANSWSLLKPMSIESVMPSNHLIFCHPLLLLLSILPSIRVFSNESALRIRWPKYWSFSFSVSPFNEHPGLVSFRMDWLDLPTVQGTLKSLLQQHSSKA